MGGGGGGANVGSGDGGDVGACGFKDAVESLDLVLGDALVGLVVKVPKR